MLAINVQKDEFFKFRIFHFKKFYPRKIVKNKKNSKNILLNSSLLTPIALLLIFYAHFLFNRHI
jgi:hypothetical protein